MAMRPIEAQLAHGQHAALVLDEECRVRFLNARMERLLGWRGEELTDARWPSVCVPSKEQPNLRLLVEGGLRGDVARGELSLVARSGRPLTVRVDVSRELRGRERVVAFVVQDVREVAAAAGPPADCVCQVSRGTGEVGIVRSLRFLDPGRDASAYVDRPVGVLLDELGARAALRCLRDVLDGPATTAADVVLSETTDSFFVVTASAVNDASACVAVRCVDAKLLPELVDAKAAQIADASRLSDRERQVLTLLLHGRGVDDIAETLKIAPRTVKFHQANVLQKVGADSRVDLLRVVL